MTHKEKLQSGKILREKLFHALKGEQRKSARELANELGEPVNRVSSMLGNHSMFKIMDHSIVKANNPTGKVRVALWGINPRLKRKKKNPHKHKDSVKVKDPFLSLISQIYNDPAFKDDSKKELIWLLLKAKF